MYDLIGLIYEPPIAELKGQSGLERFAELIEGLAVESEKHLLPAAEIEVQSPLRKLCLPGQYVHGEFLIAHFLKEALSCPQ